MLLLRIYGWVVLLVLLVAGYEFLHVTVTGLAAVGSPQPMFPLIFFSNEQIFFFLSTHFSTVSSSQPHDLPKMTTSLR